MSDTERLPPHNAEAELALLGSVVIDPEDTLLRLLPGSDEPLASAIKPGDFYIRYNGIAWRAIIDLFNEKRPIDLITLVDKIKRSDGIPDDDPTEGYVINLINQVPTSINAPDYAAIVKEKSIRRQMIRTASEIANMAFDETGDMSPSDLIASADAKLLSLSGDRDHGRLRGIKDVAHGYMEFIDSRIDEPAGSIVGMTTGLIDVDRILKGMDKGSFVLVAGRPGMGKSATVKGIEIHAATKLSKSVLSFSLEMGSQENFIRLVANLSRVDIQKLKNADIRGVDMAPTMEAIGVLSMAPMFMDDTAAVTVSAMRHKCRMIKAQYGLDLVTVDYAQLMGIDGKHGNREQQVSEISRGLKNLARDLDIIVIAAAQLSRAVEQRQDKRPLLSDLRDSGSLEQDADIVIFAYRDEYYNPVTTELKNIIEFIIAKHRNGPPGTASCYWHAPTATVRNLTTRTVSFGDTPAVRSSGKY